MVAARSLGRRSCNPLRSSCRRQRRGLAVVRPSGNEPVPAQLGFSQESWAPSSRSLSGHYFKPAPEILLFEGPVKRPDDPNKANLGKTLRVLQEHLPTLLQSPPPQHILAPNISLHLFPSTHPHLPTVSGKVAYTAALCTSPIAWNRIPLVGNVKLEILSERMTTNPLPFGPLRQGAVSEQLVVRWRTAPARGSSSGSEPSAAGPGGHDKEFTGLFVFQFDADGKVLSHTIDNADTGAGWENGVGARFVGLTDWLLGGFRGEGQPTGSGAGAGG